MLSTLLSFAVLGATTAPEMEPASSVQRIAQADNPCQSTDTVLPSESMRRLELDDFGVAVMIPENYRAILLNSGAIKIVDPGTYNLIRCQAIGGDPLGRGYSELLIRREPMPADQSLEEIVRADIYSDRPDSITGPPNQCISPYPLEDQEGVLVQSPSQRHAEFWIQPPATGTVTVLETSCDCQGMVERLTEVLSRTTLLEE